jgi:hypothetical protein
MQGVDIGYIDELMIAEPAGCAMAIMWTHDGTVQPPRRTGSTVTHS